MTQPYKIFDTLKTRNEKLKEELKALKLIDDIYKKKSYVIEKVLLRKLVQKHNKEPNWLFRITLLIITFAIGAIGEGMIQDLVWTEETKQYLCGKIGIYCT